MVSLIILDISLIILLDFTFLLKNRLIIYIIFSPVKL